MPKWEVSVEKHVSMMAVEIFEAPSEEELHKLILKELPSLEFKTDRISLEVRNIEEIRDEE